MPPIQYISVCSGIEAFSAAVHDLNYKPVAFAEIDPSACAVLAHHYAGVPNVGDFTAIRGDEYDAVDALVGGTPCQDFSVAGLRAGMDGERGQLTIEFARLAHRLAAKKRTRWLVWENVPGILSIDDGQAFAEFLSILCGRHVTPPLDGWSNFGIIEGLVSTFGLAYGVLDAQHFGVPQRRRRVFVVGYLGDWRRAAAVLLERHSLSGHPPPRREAGQGSAVGFEASAHGGGHEVDVAPTLDARCKDGPRRNQTERSLVAPGTAYGGNNTKGSIDVSTAVRAKGGTGHGDFESETFVTHTLRGEGLDAMEDGTGRGTPLVVAFSSKDHGADAGELAPTLRSMGHDGSHANGGGQITIAIQGGNTQQNGKGYSEDDIAYTLDQAQPQAVALAMAVRRLTPRECERLQGFPDDYTLVRGPKWTKLRADGSRYTRSPKRTKLMADGPRYKMLGNSMAVPVMRWIAQRMSLVDGL